MTDFRKEFGGSESDSDSSEEEKYDMPKRHYCNKCQIYQPIRTRHCKKCDACVAKFDHHCFWIGGCVGELNHRKFWAMLFFMTVQYCMAFFYVNFSL